MDTKKDERFRDLRTGDILDMQTGEVAPDLAPQTPKPMPDMPVADNAVIPGATENFPQIASLDIADSLDSQRQTE